LWNRTTSNVVDLAQLAYLGPVFSLRDSQTRKINKYLGGTTSRPSKIPNGWLARTVVAVDGEGG
jgi:hypothetical protein